jgi:UDP-4-keto-D-QuiNAc 4-reductase
LFELGRSSGLECVVVRPPLVYGPGVKANFRTMMKLLSMGVPMPLGAVTARRSLVARDNLVDLLWHCVSRSEAVGRVLMVSDAEDLSVPELLRRLGQALGKPARLIPVPPTLLDWSARLFGKAQVAKRLLWPLEVDSSATRELLGWCPPVSLDEALHSTAQAFLRSQHR